MFIVDLVGRSRLGEEARHHIHVLAQPGEENLDRDAAGNPRMLGEVDGSHAALADLRANHVVADGAANHIIIPNVFSDYGKSLQHSTMILWTQ